MSPDRLLRLALMLALRSLAMWELFIGLGTLAAALLIPSGPPGEGGAWLDAAAVLAWSVALTFLPAGAAALLLMPPRSEILRRPPLERPASLPGAVKILLPLLAALCALECVPIADWWSRNLALLEKVTGPGRDPMGLSVIPGTILLFVPIVAAATALAGMLASGLALLVRAELAGSVLRASLMLQGGLAAGGALALHRLLGLAGRGVSLLSSSAETTAAAHEVAAEAARQQMIGGGVTRGLLWITGGYLAAAAAASWLAFRDEARPGAGSVVEPRGVAEGRPGPASDDRAAVAGTSQPSRAAGAFDRATFVVQPRVRALSFLSGRHSEYGIWGYGDANGGRIAFRFDWASGEVRPEPGGAAIMALRARPGGWPARAYDVVDLSTGALLATLRADRPDWEVLDTRGRPIARVEPSSEGAHRYVARAAGSDLCRYSWYLGSGGALNPELEIEFSPGADGRLDRAVLIGLGPLLERQIRLASRPT